MLLSIFSHLPFTAWKFCAPSVHSPLICRRLNRSFRIMVNKNDIGLIKGGKCPISCYPWCYVHFVRLQKFLERVWITILNSKADQSTLSDLVPKLYTLHSSVTNTSWRVNIGIPHVYMPKILNQTEVRNDSRASTCTTFTNEQHEILYVSPLKTERKAAHFGVPAVFHWFRQLILFCVCLF